MRSMGFQERYRRVPESIIVLGVFSGFRGVGGDFGKGFRGIPGCSRVLRRF